jgi:cytochrome c
MSDRFNTIAGWVLGSGIVALGLASLSGHYFRADKDERPATMGYPIAGVAVEGGAAAAVPIEVLLAKADPPRVAQVFQKCAACHSITQGGPNMVGPNLTAWSATKSPRGAAASPSRRHWRARAASGTSNRSTHG